MRGVVYNTRLTPRDGLVRLRWSFPQVVGLRRSVSSFEGLASFSSTSVGVRRTGPPEQMDGEIVSPEYFALLGAEPVAGRTFVPGDEEQPVAVALALTRFAQAMVSDLGAVSLRDPVVVSIVVAIVAAAAAFLPARRASVVDPIVVLRNE